MLNRLAFAGPGSVFHLPAAKPAGFLAGSWHGFIIGIAFLVSLQNLNVRIYEVNNCGRLYDFGFLLGVSLGALLTDLIPAKIRS